MTAGTPEVGPVDNSAKGLPALNQRGDDGRPLRRSRCRCQQIPLDHDIAPSTSPSAFSVEVEPRFAVGQHWVQNSLHFCGVEARMWGETGLHQIVPQTDTSMPSLQKAWSGPHREARDRKVVGEQRAVHPARRRRTGRGSGSAGRARARPRQHGCPGPYWRWRRGLSGGGRGDVQAERARDLAIECQCSPRRHRARVRRRGTRDQRERYNAVGDIPREKR